MHIPILSNGGRPQRERGQALVEYALITVLVGLVFGLGLAATAPAIGTAFGRIVDDVLRQTEIADADAPGSIGFWATVTEVFNLTPSGGGLPPNTVVPTPVFTGGPTLTPSQTYTPTPLTPSPTPRPTRTPFDQEKAAPFRDTVDEAAWWRIDSNINLRGSPWTVELFDNTTLSGTAARSLPGFLNIDQTGTFATGFPSAASEGQNFSARIRRTIELLDDPNTPQADQQPLKFRILADDGVRLSVNGTPVSLRDINGSTNSWVNQGSPMLWMGSLVLAPGTHTIVVEYYHTTGTPRLKIEVTGGGANPDDAPATAGSAFICNWGILTDANNANSEANQFDDYVDGVSGTNTTCYLEWRGSVVVPDTMTAPQLVFWDVWDLPTGSEVWVEVAEYIPVDPTLPIKSANRSAMTWQRVNLAHTTGGTANYNWTRNVIDLNPLMTAFGSPKRVAFRFALRTGGTVNTRTKWHIDDIEFRDGSSTVITANRTWTFDNPDERFEFIVNAPRSNPGIESGWALVTNNRFGTSGFAWHDSVNTVVDDPNIVAGGSGGNTNPFTRYKRHTDSLQSDALNNVRVHALEFNGFINLASVPNPDAQGNTGVPVLSFYHAFDLGGRTGLVVQYTTSPYSTSPANWITLPGGVLRDITQTNNASSLTMQEVNIPLNAIPGNPAQVRLRFAMLVRPDATPRDGWWIDSIRLGRASAPRWLNYPFFDDAQVNGPQLFWVYGGQWQVASNIGYRGLATTGNPADARSYASSPNSNYANNQTTAITMRWPIDLYNDTPSKQVIEDGSGDLITSNSSGAPATSTSELTFYHRRVIAATDQFRVEWKRASEADTSWRPLWSYRRGMQTNPSTTNDRTARNDAWEFTRVSLYPIFRQFTLDGNGLPGVGTGTALTDDDIVFRFTIVADNNSNARGVYVDDIRIQERVNREIKLWPTGEVRVNPANTSQSVGIGTARNVTIDPDFISTGDDWRTFFRFSGDWNAISFESRQGVLSLHDSVVGGQDRAPTGFRNTATNSDDTGDGAWRTRNYSFTTLEMQPVIDLRGVNAQTEAPRLTFWTRMHLARYDWAYVQVSLEDTRSETDINNSMNARCGNPTPALLQCYEQERGWGSWQTIWSIGTDSDDNGTRAYGWQYMSVDLSPFAYQPSTNTAGRRIRLRFVIDSLTDNTNADGFYLDDIQLEHRLPTPVGMSTVINQGSFVDPSRNLNNWIGEGLWNLDTAVFQGGGGGPVSLGVWNVRWWNCGGCSNLHPSNNFADDVNAFLLNPTPAAGDRSASVTSINYNFFGGSPVSGWTPTDRLVMRATIDTPVVGVGFTPGPRGFTTRADDGVRLKVEELVGGVPVSAPYIINRFTDSSPRTDQGSFTFENGKRYRITLEYFENSGEGLITLTITDGRFSFSDSPKFVAGPTPDQMPIPYANTSLVMRHVLDLRGIPTNSPVVLEYDTKYRLNNSSTARVEVSIDGGFTWTDSGLGTALPAPYNGLPISGSSFSNTTFGWANGEGWAKRFNNLTSYKERFVLIRFRLDRRTTYCVTPNDCDNSDAETNPSLALTDGYYIGWWITPVIVRAL